MDMKRNMLIYYFKSILVDTKKEWGSYKMEILIRNGLLWKLIGKGSSYEIVRLENMKVIRIKAKVKWMEKGEWGSKKFFKTIGEWSRGTTIMMVKKMDGDIMKITKELEDTCCIFYLTFYDLGPISLVIDWLKKEAFNTTLEKFNQKLWTPSWFLCSQKKSSTTLINFWP
jgi:hypothetical protein